MQGHATIPFLPLPHPDANLRLPQPVPGDGTVVLAHVGDSVITARDLEAQVAFFGHSKYLMEHYSNPKRRRRCSTA